MQERIQKILSGYGIASRRKAEDWIRQGRILVNGAVCKLGDRADAEIDEILVDGTPLSGAPELIYIILNKPRGYVTTAQDEKRRKTVLELVDCPQRVYPVGRLDMDSEGLLLLTNDGELTNRLLHPSNEIKKTYRVWVEGYSTKGLQRLMGPMEIDGFALSPAEVTLMWENGGNALLEMTIHEGRNRQIRKMAVACGMKVSRLQRIQEGPLRLGKLPPGQWRELTKQELFLLQNLHEKG